MDTDPPKPAAPTRRRWYQFTLGGMLGATAWMAVFCGLLSLTSWTHEVHNPLLLAAIMGALVLSPFIALGTLFGRPFRGLLLGVVLVALYASVIAIAVITGWIRLGC